MFYYIENLKVHVQKFYNLHYSVLLPMLERLTLLETIDLFVHWKKRIIGKSKVSIGSHKREEKYSLKIKKTKLINLVKYKKSIISKTHVGFGLTNDTHAHSLTEVY